MFSDDEIVFADETDTKGGDGGAKKSWKLLIVDDEEQIHTVTKLALKGVEYQGRALEFLSAYNSMEAKEILARNDDIALLLLDVVMESDEAGLELTKYIRDVQKNGIVRIILRTGQPGQAPERQVILDYDINDYKNKAELTSQGLFTAVISALRSYQDIYSVNASKAGLEEIIKATSSILEQRAFEGFIEGVLLQVVAIMKDTSSAMFCTGSDETGDALTGLRAISCTGKFESRRGRSFGEIVGIDRAKEIKKQIEARQNPSVVKHYIGYFKSIQGRQNLIYIELDRVLEEYETRLLDLFISNVSVALDNVELIAQIKSNQVEILNMMGNLSENHSKETSNHVRRVTEYAYLLGSLAGLSAEECELLKEASSIHDIGKLVVPDEILNKPSRLTDEEFEVIKTHAAIGGELLKNCEGKILRVGGLIANQHHEKYNGKGYPAGLKGDEIHIYGRIVALVDVFDALSQKRCYKEPWSRDAVLDLMQKERGEHFDPLLVDAFAANIDRFYEIKERLKD